MDRRHLLGLLGALAGLTLASSPASAQRSYAARYYFIRPRRRLFLLRRRRYGPPQTPVKPATPAP